MHQSVTCHAYVEGSLTNRFKRNETWWRTSRVKMFAIIDERVSGRNYWRSSQRQGRCCDVASGSSPNESLCVRQSINVVFAVANYQLVIRTRHDHCLKEWLFRYYRQTGHRCDTREIGLIDVESIMEINHNGIYLETTHSQRSRWIVVEMLLACCV